MRWEINFYDFRFKSTATVGFGIHPTKPRLSQLVNYKNAITWKERYAIKLCFKLGKMQQKRMECFRLLLDHLAWIEHQFSSGIRNSRKAGSLWGMMWGVGGVRKSIHQSWLAKELRLGLLYWGFKGFQEEIPSRVSGISTRILHQSLTPYSSQTILTKMGIKTLPQPPYSLDLAPCDYWLFPKLRGCSYETIEEMKEAVTKVIDTLTRGLPRGLWEDVVFVQQVHCNRRILLRRGLEFHVCTINKSTHMKKVGKLIVCTSYVSRKTVITITVCNCDEATQPHTQTYRNLLNYKIRSITECIWMTPVCLSKNKKGLEYTVKS